MISKDKTTSAKKETMQHKWYIVDADGQTLGRLASQIAFILRGKHKPSFSPHVDCGDFVVVTNANKVKLTANKETTKQYHRHTGYFGGLKTMTPAEMRIKTPEKILELAVKGMIPANILGRDVYRKLKVYAGADHPHAAQKPEPLPARTKGQAVLG